MKQMASASPIKSNIIPENTKKIANTIPNAITIPAKKFSRLIRSTTASTADYPLPISILVFLRRAATPEQYCHYSH